MREDLVHPSEGCPIGEDDRVELRRQRFGLLGRPGLRAQQRQVLLRVEQLPLRDEIEDRRGVDRLARRGLDAARSAAHRDGVLARRPGKPAFVVQSERTVVGRLEVVRGLDGIERHRPGRLRGGLQHGHQGQGSEGGEVEIGRLGGGGAVGIDLRAREVDGDRHFLVVGKALLRGEGGEQF